MSEKKGITFRQVRSIVDKAYLLDDEEEISLSGTEFTYAHLKPVPEEFKKTINILLDRFKPRYVNQKRSTRFICPNCGGVLTRGKMYCRDCGQRLAWERKEVKKSEESEQDEVSK